MSALPRYVPSSTSLNELTYSAHWLRSSRSTGMNNCVEATGLRAGPLAGLLAVRDSKRTTGPALLFPPTVWNAFLDAVRGEEF
ncbi:DUF397 domain-containing protein [Streptomyces sp. T-3]|nr:DUF397 domain-containing protein [Streptomyces sp. T-3]